MTSVEGETSRTELEARLSEARRRIAALEAAEADRHRRVRESEERYRTIFDASRDAIMILGPAGMFRSGNPAAVELFGCESEAHFTSLAPADLSPRLQPDGTTSHEKAGTMIRKALAEGSHFFEWRHSRVDGTEFPATVLLTRTVLDGEELLQATVRDITDQKDFEERLRAAKEAAESASTAKSDFLANMSHEIRTPMTAILGMTDLLLSADPTDRQREYLDILAESSETLLTLIDDILDLSRIEAGRIRLDPAPFDLREALGDSLRLLAVRAHGKGLELAFDVRADVPERVVGDAGRLRQIVMNLVGNGIKFTEAGEVLLEVTVAESDENRVLLGFTASDTGIGIPEDRQAAIFGAFEQVDPSLSRRFGGTGLGLSISRRLVEMMGGEVRLESEVGRGSAFRWTAEFGVAAGAREDRPEELRGLRVLVVDDNATNLRILREMIAVWDMRPAAVTGTDEAVEMLRNAFRQGEPFELVLVDADMPGADGFELADRIRRDPELASTILMMLTSGHRPADVVRGRELGVVRHLAKPVKHSELYDALLAAMGLGGVEEPATARLPVGDAGPSRRILLAEDSLINQRLTVELLRRAGHEVVVAGDGREALGILEREQFDVILMDVQMPEMDGLEAVRRIRARERETGGHVPVLALTAHALKGDREVCLDAGMDGYVSKPIRPEELFRAIEAATGGSVRVDVDAALRSLGGNRKLLDIVTRAALDESPSLLKEIRRSVAYRDPAGLRLATHALKGGFRYFGDNAATDLAHRLERMGQGGDLAGAEDLLAPLEEAVLGLLSRLEETLGERR